VSIGSTRRNRGLVGAGLPRTYRLGAPWCRWISRR